jgi:regulator of sigma E protease
MGARGDEALLANLLNVVPNILLAVVAVSVLIIVHELGHFITAKAVGMRVEVFSIGFWKRLFGFRIGETDYRVSLIPLGGYVKVTGESADEGSGDPHEFWSKTPGQRALFVVGGVTMNFLLAIVLFIVAFAIGVPFTVAEVGDVARGEPAWRAGLQAGDVITRVGDVENPNFIDLTRAIALGGGDTVDLAIDREGREMRYELEPEYDELAGIKLIGILPPIEPLVTALVAIDDEDDVSPAAVAGVEVGDRILSVNGVAVDTARDVAREMLSLPSDPVELVLDRDGERVTVSVTSEPVPYYRIGISGHNATIDEVASKGWAERLGLRPGDIITASNGEAIRSANEIEVMMWPEPGPIDLAVTRGDEELAFRVDLADRKDLEDFMGSLTFEDDTVLDWVAEGTPAWRAGMRPGDKVLEVGGDKTEEWLDVLIAGRRAGRDEHEIVWDRDGVVMRGVVAAEADTSTSPGHLGIQMTKDRTRPERYGVFGAVVQGVRNTRRTIGEIFLMLRGFATREVSPKQMGGIVMIGYASYTAAQEGFGKLFFLMAVISAAIAFLNILPIPVLDGGHLLFIAIEKVRGRRLGERALTIAQTVGFVLLMLLVIYVTRNDIMRFFLWR